MPALSPMLRPLAPLLLAAACAAEPAPPPAVTAEPVLTATETILGQPIAWPAGRPEVTAAVITVPPGAETGWHSHPVPLFAWMLEGALTVTHRAPGVPPTERTYRPGDALMEAIATPHNGRNAGAAPVRILAGLMGAEGVGNSEAVE